MNAKSVAALLTAEALNSKIKDDQKDPAMPRGAAKTIDTKTAGSNAPHCSREGGL